jgi:hypothetical protein
MKEKRLLWPRLICAGIILLLVGACASGPKVSNDFVEQKSRIEKVAVISDVAVSYDVEGDLHQIDVAECKMLGNDINRLVQSGLVQKGWSADNTEVSSVGIFLNDSLQFKIVNKPGQPAGQEPTVEHAPFYIGDNFKQNPTVEDALKTLYRSLDAYDMKATGLPPAFFKEATIVGKHLDSDAMAVVIVGGNAVPVGKSIKQAIATSIMTLGVASAWQTSQVQIKFFVLDTTSGKVLLADEDYRKGGLANRKEIMDMTNDMVEQLPKK